MTNGKINVSVENIFPLIKKFLYSDHEIFLRELISKDSSDLITSTIQKFQEIRGENLKVLNLSLIHI